jgi:hypothetical protein
MIFLLLSLCDHARLLLAELVGDIWHVLLKHLKCALYPKGTLEHGMSPVTEARSETRAIGIGACRLDSSTDVGAVQSWTAMHSAPNV